MARRTWFACLALLLVGCATITVISDHDPKINFGAYKTFDFLPRQGSGFWNPLMVGRVQDAIESELITKGFQRTSSDPDFQVVFHASSKENINITDWGYGYQSGYWRSRDIDVHTYTEGTLIVDLIDAKMKELAWRGTGTGVVGDPEKMKEKVGEAVQKILADFPPQ